MITVTIVIDVETTGLDPEKDGVVEFAAVPVSADGHNSGFVHADLGASTLVNPGIPIAPAASAVHHLIDADVETAPPLDGAVLRILSLVSIGPDADTIFAAHNARCESGDGSTPIGARGTSGRMRQPTATRCYDIGSACRFRAICPVHRALGDATVTAHLLARLLDDRGLDDLVTLSTKAVMLKTVGFGKHFGQLWTDVPRDYLEWLQRQPLEDPDVRFTVKSELLRRRPDRSMI